MTEPLLIGSVLIELPLPSAKLSGQRRRSFSVEEVSYLRANYRRIVEAGKLGELSALMRRSKSVLSEKAKTLGLTDAAAAKRIASAAARKSERWANRRPAKGMRGKHHHAATRETLRQSSKAWWASLSAQEKSDRVNNNLRAAIAKNGRIGPVTPKRETSWKAGWRDIADKRHYFRSRWEANYARYLQWLKERGDILDWEYEPETFWFDKIKRGVRSYLPDFRVHELNGTKPLHEVKGWMDARSKTTLKRMAKYHPQETIILIREKEYRALSRFSALIGGWE